MERNYHSDSEESDAEERTYDETLQYLMGPAGNHEGRDRTHAKIQEKYYWPGVTKDVKQWVS